MARQIRPTEQRILRGALRTVEHNFRALDDDCVTETAPSDDTLHNQEAPSVFLDATGWREKKTGIAFSSQRHTQFPSSG